MTNGEEREPLYLKELTRLLDEVEVGTEAQIFLDSKVGRHLIDQAIIEQEEAFMDFMDVDPNDAKAIIEIQNKAKAPNRVFAWLTDAIRKGSAATEQLADIELESIEQ